MSPHGHAPSADGRYQELVAAGEGLLVALDFDGTLAPIVADPDRARLPATRADGLAARAGHVRAISVSAGGPVRRVLEPGGLALVADRAPRARLLVAGQYGNERWVSAHPTVMRPPPPEGLAAVRDELAHVLDQASVPDA